MGFVFIAPFESFCTLVFAAGGWIWFSGFVDDEGVAVTDDRWAELCSALPKLVFIEFDDDANPVQRWSFVRLRDSVTGSDVVFYENGTMVEVTVTVPHDPVVADRVLDVLAAQRVWHQNRYREESWGTGWHALRAEDSYKMEVSAAVIAVMRDGLGMSLERLRYTAGDETGLDSGPWALRDLLTSERPTDRNAPDSCTDWSDFAERLDWVLTTLPSYDIVTLVAPAVMDLSAVQLMQDAGKLEAAAIVRKSVTGPELIDLDLQLRATRWQKQDDMGTGFPTWWHGPFSSAAGFADRRIASIPSLTVTTFRAVFGVASPQELAVTGHHDIAVSGRQAYISRELGIPVQSD
ncbi:TY-Chap domain-containing protein [Nocardia fluminea]|uniref:TY-Chap domain-containing protein n=1 Tax=Nocardia fluminea TaxID=134984 RepID=UPI00341B4541